jgi:phosphoribosyl-ATP pyrophosphohydrolase/phosphoribosyl-AMP cyclohydrolase
MAVDVKGTIRFGEDGLIPAVVQDAGTGRVLMLAWMNAESLERTRVTGETWFWSRSRRALWHKGEKSGNTQRVCSLTADCDGDTLLVKVDPKGPACHTGAVDCFGAEDDARLGSALDRLAGIIHQRAVDKPEGSYTVTLLLQGLDRVLRKIGEEAGEVIIAGKNGDSGEIVREAADLLYHLLVLLEERGIPGSSVGAELRGRMR